MPSDVRRTSTVYARVQTTLLCAFAMIFFFDNTQPLFAVAETRLLGDVLCAVGVGLLFAALTSIRRAVQIAPEPRPGARLITSGVYGWLRHPIYTAIVLLVVGLFLRKRTAAIGIVAVGVIIFLAAKVKFEERLLAATYAEYLDYKRRTWGIVPGFR